jgi:trimethylamine:corrinoid methyltransferase-like protein
MDMNTYTEWTLYGQRHRLGHCHRQRKKTSKDRETQKTDRETDRETEKETDMKTQKTDK